MMPEKRNIHAAMSTLCKTCSAVENCSVCPLFSEEKNRCILRVASPNEWKLNDPPAETWRVTK